MSVAYMQSENEILDDIYKWQKGKLKGFLGAAYNLVVSIERIPETLVILDQQAIEYDYYYRQTYYKEHGKMPSKYSVNSKLSLIANGAKKSIIYALDDYDTRVLHGDLESQGEYLGEYLFNVALDLALGGYGSKLDDVAEYSDDAARLTTKQLDLDDAYSKAKGGNLLDADDMPDDLPDVKIHGNIFNYADNNKEINIIGKINSELDEVDFLNKVIYEDKNAQGLYLGNPDYPQTEMQWAEKQIFGKGKNRIDALKQDTFRVRINSVDYPLLVDDLRGIKTYVFRINADTPELRKAVDYWIEELDNLYPEYDFSAVYGI